MLGVPYSEGRQCIVGWRAEGGGGGLNARKGKTEGGRVDTRVAGGGNVSFMMKEIGYIFHFLSPLPPH